MLAMVAQANGCWYNNNNNGIGNNNINNNDCARRRKLRQQAVDSLVAHRHASLNACSVALGTEYRCVGATTTTTAAAAISHLPTGLLLFV